MTTLNLKPGSAAAKKYYAALGALKDGNFSNEGHVRGAFAELLKSCARPFGWSLVEEYRVERKGRKPMSVDGALLDAFNMPRGYWEAKDEKDTLEAEMKKKFEVSFS